MSLPDLVSCLTFMEAGGPHAVANGYGALILYDTRATDDGAVITTDSEAEGFEAVQLFNWRPTNSWKPDAAGTHYVDVALTTPGDADCFAFGRYALGDPDATIVLRYSPDGGADGGDTWIDCFPPIRMGDWRGRPKMIAFASVTSPDWRVQVVSAVAASAVAVVAFGVAYWPKYAQLPGFKPFLTARAINDYTATSEEGLMLGRTLLSVVTKNGITFEHMTEAEWQYEWAPFLLHAESFPFFIAPLLSTFPDEVGLVERDGQIPMPAYSRPRRFSVSMPMQGICP